VFNGKVGALSGSGALSVKVDESVRIYFGNAGPNLTSSLHIAGEVFDSVYADGSGQVTQRGLSTVVVPAGGATIVELKFDVPGTYEMVDRAMFRSSHKGAVGTIRVEGDDNDLIFTQRTAIEAFAPETRLVRASHGRQVDAITDPKQLLQHGSEVYARVCSACHGKDGSGVPKAIPPLADSDYLMEDLERSIRIVSEGLRGKIVVNGVTYDSEMPNPALDDQEIASVLSFVRNNFGNRGDMVSLDEVLRVRNGGAQELDVRAVAKTTANRARHLN
jgi:nitrite reductase (NO-forming)